MARPTDYTPELVEKAQRYLGVAQEVDDVYPSIAGLAFELGISRETVYAWSKDESKAVFSDIVDQILILQEMRLSHNGLKGIYNASITKLMLSKHGYRESSDITTDGKALPTPILGAATKDETH